MKQPITIGLALLALGALALGPARAQQGGGYQEASQGIERKLEDSLRELADLGQRIADEKVPLARELNELEARRIAARQEFQEATRLVDRRSLDLSNLSSEIERRKGEGVYVSNLLSDYLRGFESRLHVSERQRYEEQLDAARLAVENANLSDLQVFEVQAALLEASVERLHAALGGDAFEGSAIDDEGLVRKGTFVLVGPTALFRSTDGETVGVVEQRLDSQEPAVIPFSVPEDAQAAARVVSNGGGEMPFDTTLGKALVVEATQETFLDEVNKGGAVIWAIFALAALGLLIAFVKFVGLMFQRKPSRRKLAALLRAVEAQDEDAAVAAARRIGGPVGRMLTAGAEHLREPRELIEEVMYEIVLKARLKLNRLLPFIAVCAASAPLLGLLGTVTGIIRTFKEITIYGSGDVKTLSGGISEALITTKYGLVVAIPSLLIHAFLSRRARAVVGNMETSAVALLNEASRSGMTSEEKPTRTVELGPTPAPVDSDQVRRQVGAILEDMLGPLVDEARDGAGRPVASVGARD